MQRLFFFTLTAISLVALSSESTRIVALRSRTQLFRGSNEWSEVRSNYTFQPSKSAVIICDMWDKHWCSGANTRVAMLVKRMEPFLENARHAGITIIHRSERQRGQRRLLPG